VVAVEPATHHRRVWEYLKDREPSAGGHLARAAGLSSCEAGSRPAQRVQVLSEKQLGGQGSAAAVGLELVGQEVLAPWVPAWAMPREMVRRH
jgi:hypothetical protein